MHKNKIWTSNWTIVELLLVAQEFGLDPENLIVSIKHFADIRGDIRQIVSAAHLMKSKDISLFDALHSVSCENDEIITSDSVFDKLGLKRIALEKLKTV